MPLGASRKAPAYAVVLIDADGVVVHFHDFPIDAAGCPWRLRGTLSRTSREGQDAASRMRRPIARQRNRLRLC
ncbi:MAG: hypothetical protein EOR97_08810 [Mesorhizobium sp.]|nr:MAG: hypothetical protein EOR97_08810 [Mesorhizobium sp.]